MKLSDLKAKYYVLCIPRCVPCIVVLQLDTLPGILLCVRCHVQQNVESSQNIHQQENTENGKSTTQNFLYDFTC